MTGTEAKPLLTPEIEELLGLIGDADSVELKLTVPDEDRRSAVRELGLDPLDARIREVYFFDTPDLLLDRNGVVVRARRTQAAPDDTVIKLRPVVPTELPDELRARDDFVVEVDAMPGKFVCSGSFKGRSKNGRVREAVVGSRPLSKVFSKDQRAFFAEHAPPGVELDDLAVLGPVMAFKLKLRPTGMTRKLAVELWLYPDGSRLLELSTKCAPVDWYQATSESRDYLQGIGVNLSGAQETKTRKALEHFASLV
jgi:hypothetical protein